ncbi:ankyrin repeat domain-containing protein [Aggregatimonas sangjinii]|uniref:Ankyrin repeat domain-containing protein n=1 Tax=Aggregatimonas sangjinii TaxID=2583587 RepID=A0A5B7SY55_9FLAO|nr:ankyrin repeat domain-containing protein [Aggregatimonas sangjinii]QCX01694.1 ankyrin repeat domain-containing protein [Aggregatimonas sangjinii]
MKNVIIVLLLGFFSLSLSAQQNDTKYEKNKFDCQELLKAVKDGNVQEIKRLLKTIDPNCVYREDGEPRSPLVSAARTGNLEIGRLLVDAKADIEFHAMGDETPLMAASKNGGLDFVKYLISNGAKVNKQLLGDGTALLVAARNGHLKTVSYLLSEGAEVNAVVPGDGTALIQSIKNNHYDISEILLENGADPYLASPGDEYPMFYALESSRGHMVALLEKYQKK